MGRKSGKGFSVAEALPPPPDAEETVLRIEAALVNEAAFLTLEGGVAPPEIDTAMRLGLNFPRGPFAALHHWGRSRILATLAACATKAPAALHGRYTPAPLLSDPGAETGIPEKSSY